MEFDRVYAAVHLDRIEENMKAMRGNLAPGTKIIGTVKTDGYGHGAVAVAKAIAPYVAGYAVAAPEEALELRRHGIAKPILILGVTGAGWYEEMIREKVRLTVFELSRAEEISRAVLRLREERKRQAEAGTQESAEAPLQAAAKTQESVKALQQAAEGTQEREEAPQQAAEGQAPENGAEYTAKLHIAVDTGMSRIGLAPTAESVELVKRIAALPGIELEGMFTHFARADEADKTETVRQFERFTGFRDRLLAAGIRIPLCHCANSAGIVELPQMQLDAVRAGITIYGMYPSAEVDRTRVALLPAMELKSFITYIKELEPGRAVSYGGTFVADRPLRVATVSVGYGDGYPRALSGKGSCLIAGKRARILGRVCMDQMMVDVTEIPEAQEGTRVTLLGRDGELEITMEELAALSGGFHYEIPCLINRRVPRVYLRDGRQVGSMTGFESRYEGF